MTRYGRTAAEIKRSIRPGDVFDVLNHYIDRPDHPAYGMTRRVVAKVTGSSFTFENGYPIKFPPARFMYETEDGAIKMHGLGASQAPGDLTLTMWRIVPMYGSAS